MYSISLMLRNLYLAGLFTSFLLSNKTEKDWNQGHLRSLYEVSYDNKNNHDDDNYTNKWWLHLSWVIKSAIMLVYQLLSKSQYLYIFGSWRGVLLNEIKTNEVSDPGVRKPSAWWYVLQYDLQIMCLWAYINL